MLRAFPVALASLALVTACGGQSGAESAVKKNGTACDSYRFHIADLGSTITELGKRTVTMAVALPVIKTDQARATSTSTYSSGGVSTSLSKLADDLGRAGASMSASGTLAPKDATVLTADLAATDAACKAAGY